MMENPKGFGTRFRTLVDSKYDNYKEPAAALGITYEYLHQIMNGVRNPSVELLVKIREHFDVTIDTLLGLPEKPKPPALQKTLDIRSINQGPSLMDVGPILERLVATSRPRRALVLALLFEDGALIPDDLKDALDEAFDDFQIATKTN